MLVVTTDGNAWRVSSAGVATRLASLGTHLEGLTTVPNNSAKYGPWAGRALELKGDAQEALGHYSKVAQWDFNYLDVQARIKDIRGKLKGQ